VVFKTLVYSPFNLLTWLVVQESFIAFGHHQSYRLYIYWFWYN